MFNKTNVLELEHEMLYSVMTLVSYFSCSGHWQVKIKVYHSDIFFKEKWYSPFSKTQFFTFLHHHHYSPPSSTGARLLSVPAKAYRQHLPP